MQWEHRRSYHACQNWYLGFGFITNTISRSTRAFIFFPFQARALPMDGGREITDMMLGFYESRGILLSPPTTRKTAPGFLQAFEPASSHVWILHFWTIVASISFYESILEALFSSNHQHRIHAWLFMPVSIFSSLSVSPFQTCVMGGKNRVLLFLSIYFYTSTFCYIKIRLYTLYTMYSY